MVMVAAVMNSAFLFHTLNILEATVECDLCEKFLICCYSDMCVYDV